MRNDVSYAAGMVFADDVQDTADAVQRLVSHATAFVRPHLPGWMSGDPSAG